MGLLSLKEKIMGKLSQQRCCEEDALYLLVEIGKYLERSRQDKIDLGDSDDLRLDSKNYPTILFFRNWAAHTVKDRGEIPAVIRACLDKVLNGEGQKEDELMQPLAAELSKFAGELKADVRIPWDAFSQCLKRILAEQPVTLDVQQKQVGYDQTLTLRRF